MSAYVLRFRFRSFVWLSLSPHVSRRRGARGHALAAALVSVRSAPPFLALASLGRRSLRPFAFSRRVATLLCAACARCASLASPSSLGLRWVGASLPSAARRLRPPRRRLTTHRTALRGGCCNLRTSCAALSSLFRRLSCRVPRPEIGESLIFQFPAPPSWTLKYHKLC